MDKKTLEHLDSLLSDYINNKVSSETLIINLRLIKKKVHNDFLEDVIQYLNGNGFNCYYCGEEKKIFAFVV
ncbi:hypothetical protein [Vibrio jasicida]|uniref:hypothetical protein n=1 Tax=Vibrio jasicida TaxID=766224 RepID=UPI0039096240